LGKGVMGNGPVGLGGPEGMGTGMLGFGRPLGLGIGIGGLGDVPEKYCAAVTGIGIHGIAGGGGIPGITQLGTLGRSISLSTFAAGGRNESALDRACVRKVGLA